MTAMTAVRSNANRTHDDEVARRLRRIEGQVAGIRTMHEHDRYCIEILDQLSAARAALKAVALLLLEDHVNGCVRDAVDRGEADRQTAELLSTVRRFVRSV